MSRINHSLKLSEARAKTPAVNAVEAMRSSLQLALFGAVTEGDVAGMAAKLKEMALAGDLKAMKLFFQLVEGGSKQAPQLGNLERAIGDLSDEVARIRERVVLPAPAPEDAPRYDEARTATPRCEHGRLDGECPACERQQRQETNGQAEVAQ